MKPSGCGLARHGLTRQRRAAAKRDVLCSTISVYMPSESAPFTQHPQTSAGAGGRVWEASHVGSSV